MKMMFLKKELAAVCVCFWTICACVGSDGNCSAPQPVAKASFGISCYDISGKTYYAGQSKTLKREDLRSEFFLCDVALPLIIAMIPYTIGNNCSIKGDISVDLDFWRYYTDQYFFGRYNKGSYTDLVGRTSGYCNRHGFDSTEKKAVKKGIKKAFWKRNNRVKTGGKWSSKKQDRKRRYKF